MPPTVVLPSAGGAVPQLVVARPGEQDLVFPLDKPSMRLGRADDCDIKIPAPSVSRLHALLIEQQGQYTLVDQGSANGLYLAGQRVSKAVLKPGERLRIPDPLGNTITLSFQPASSATGSAGVAPAAYSQVFDLDPNKNWFSIGRDPANDLTIDLPLVSRFHARLERQGGQIVLHDLGSTNGTFVEGQRITTPTALKMGDHLQIGPADFSFQGTRLQQSGRQQAVRIDGVDLVRRTGGRDAAVILNKVSLSILPREFVALIGGSGAGKSTLMHALSGAIPAQEGAVLYNGQDFYRRPGPYNGMIGYVPQDDILHRDMPVERALDYAVQLRLPPDTTRAERARRIDEVLADVRMEQHRHKPISKLSGGQRKRVSIALELLANPSVLYLDEPTSGLDPGLDKTIMSQLQLLSDKGHTVVLVTHATENIQLCDLVAIVARGRLVYYGPPADAQSFFGVASYPDIYRYCDQHADTVEQVEAAFRQSPHYGTYVHDRSMQTKLTAVPTAPHVSLKQRQLRYSALRQWWILSRRYAELVWRDRINLILLLAQAPIVGFLLILVADSNSFTPGEVGPSQQILLMLTLAAIWFGTINAAREIVKERPIYQRERMVNLRIWPYVLSKFGVLSVLSLLQSVVLLALVAVRATHLLTHSILLPAFVELSATLILTSLAGLCAGLLISSIVSSADRAMSVVPVLLLALAIFCGGIFELRGSTEYISYLFFSHWCLAALGSSADMNGIAAQSPLPLPGWPKRMFASPDTMHLVLYWLVLVGFIALFLVGTYVALRRRDNRPA